MAECVGLVDGISEDLREEMNDIKKALSEDQAASNILATLDRINHFNMMRKKYGPRNGDGVIYVYKDAEHEKFFADSKYLDDFVKGLAKSIRELDPLMRNRTMKSIVKMLYMNVTVQKVTM